MRSETNEKNKWCHFLNPLWLWFASLSNLNHTVVGVSDFEIYCLGLDEVLIFNVLLNYWMADISAVSVYLIYLMIDFIASNCVSHFFGKYI